MRPRPDTTTVCQHKSDTWHIRTHKFGPAFGRLQAISHCRDKHRCEDGFCKRPHYVQNSALFTLISDLYWIDVARVPPDEICVTLVLSDPVTRIRAAKDLEVVGTRKPPPPSDGGYLVYTFYIYNISISNIIFVALRLKLPLIPSLQFRSPKTRHY